MLVGILGAATEALSHRTVLRKDTAFCEQRTQRTFAHEVKKAELGVHAKQASWLSQRACFVLGSIRQQRHRQTWLQ